MGGGGGGRGGSGGGTRGDPGPYAVAAQVNSVGKRPVGHVVSNTACSTVDTIIITNATGDGSCEKLRRAGDFCFTVSAQRGRGEETQPMHRPPMVVTGPFAFAVAGTLATH